MGLQNLGRSVVDEIHHLNRQRGVGTDPRDTLLAELAEYAVDHLEECHQSLSPVLAPARMSLHL